MPTTNCADTAAMSGATRTPNEAASVARGATPPYSVAQTIAWAEQRTRSARALAERWVPGSRRRRHYDQERDRFDAILTHLHRLHHLDTTTAIPDTGAQQ